MTVQTLLAGAVFGLALAAPPGPMNAIIAEESVLRGWIAGFTAGLGAMSADLLFFLLSTAGVVAVLRDAPEVRAALVAVGGVVMLYFAAGAASETSRAFGAHRSDENPPTDGATLESDRTGSGSGSESKSESATRSNSAVEARGFRNAFVLALTNPYQILFWLTVGVGLLEPGTVDVLSYLPGVGSRLTGAFVVHTGSPALLVGLFGGILVWIVAFPASLVWLGRRTDAFAPAIAGASALVLAGFGLSFLWEAARAFG